MAIFKRRDSGSEQTTVAQSTEAVAQAGQLDQPGDLMTAGVGAGVATATRSAVAPGVVPPPAAPVYSMRPPESARYEGDAEIAAVERVRVAAETRRRRQESVQGRLEVAVERSRSSASSARGGVQRQAARQPAPALARSRARGPIPVDPSRIAATGLLNLAWSWQEAGAPIRAIHAYMQLLSRYPGTPAATAAVADLVDLSDKLAGTGQFHIALAIYDQLEELLA